MLLIIGIIFTFVGAVLGIIFIFIGITSDMIEFIPAGILFGGVFAGFGILFLTMAIKELQRVKTIISFGQITNAQIIAYEDNTTTYINGVPLLDLIVLLELNGERKIARVGTNTTNTEKYPLNSVVPVAVYNSQIVLNQK